MLILATFDISDPLEKIIKLIIKVDQSICTGCMVFYLCTNLGGNGFMWGAGGSKKDQEKGISTSFFFLTPWIWLQK